MQYMLRLCYVCILLLIKILSYDPYKPIRFDPFFITMISRYSTIYGSSFFLKDFQRNAHPWIQGREPAHGPCIPYIRQKCSSGLFLKKTGTATLCDTRSLIIVMTISSKSTS
jgi:hypothetical protein